MNSWVKQPQQLLAKYFNAAGGDAVQGGALASVPSGVLGANQGSQTIPGDRLILDAADALALSNTTIGTLYGGLYQYVKVAASSSAAPTLGHICWWDTSVADSTYQVTPDQPSSKLVAGVFINTPTKGYYWWILVSGKVSGVFKTPLTGAAAVGQAAYADSTGVFDVQDAGTNPTFTQFGDLLNAYMGVAETLPVAGAASLVDVPLNHVFRY